MADLYPFRDVEMTEGDFKRISALVYELCGIHLHEGKKELVKSRLGKRIRQGKFKSFRDYYQCVIQDPQGPELIHMLDALSTNFTSFFREEKHFDFLKNELLPGWVTRKKGEGRKFNFWSAGCSSGEETYSIAITLLEALERPGQWEVRILGTDLSSRMLKMAAAGVYSRERIRSLSPALTKKYFLRGTEGWEDYVKIKDRVKECVSFQRLNLKDPFSFRDPFDCIFCRNVMIYFDRPGQTSLVARLHASLSRGGVLLIGHSESLTGIPHPFRYLRPAVYQKES